MGKGAKGGTAIGIGFRCSLSLGYQRQANLLTKKVFLVWPFWFTITYQQMLPVDTDFALQVQLS